MTEKTTDQMILDLVAAGFVLPEGLRFRKGATSSVWQFREPAAGTDPGGWYELPRQGQAYDLCALEFARQAYGRKGESEQMFSARLDCVTALAKGDSAAAIQALWKGVCGGQV